MELRTEMKQKLSLSVRMRQCMSILAMDFAQLEEYVEEQELENPLLELSEQYQWLQESGTVVRIERTEDAGESEDMQESWQGQEEEKADLYFQLSGYRLEDSVQKAAEYILESLDEKGYFTEEIDETAAALGIEKRTVEKGLEIVQKMEPYGVGARNLAECLSIQLTARNPEEKNAGEIIRNSLDLLAQGKYAEIAKELKISTEEVKRCARLIKSLDPRPYHAEEKVQRIRYLTADVLVVKYEDHYDVMPNQVCLPQIRINEEYRAMLSEPLDEKTRQYIKERLEKAMWLRDCVEKRQETILAVAELILRNQEEFLRAGPSGLRPLKLKDAAEQLQVHPSTISRAVKNKYMQTNWGIYPLRYFFTSGVEQEEGALSSAQIRTAIQQLIQKEDKEHPYSDQKIGQILKERGIHVSRRTIAAYRDQMKIPSSTLRKKML